MISVRGSRVGSLALAILLLGTALAGTGVAAPVPDSASPPTPTSDGTSPTTPVPDGATTGGTDGESATVNTVAATPETGAATPETDSTALATPTVALSDRPIHPQVDEPPSASNATVTERGGRASVTGTATAVANATRRLVATQSLRLTPAEPGTVTVTVEYEVPGNVTTLETQVPENATVTGTDGFARNGSVYEWDGETRTASVTYTTDVNESRNVLGPEGGPGKYLFVDVGEWAFFRRPAIRTTWGWRGPEPVGLVRETSLSGPGYVGEWMVYMGEHRVVERRAHGQSFNLVVPERSTLHESPERILDSLSTASDQLRVGDRDERVVAFAVPTTTVEWAARGLQFGETDMWVRDVEPLDTVENTWIHEYVHTRQDYEPTVGTQWTVEALATYYAALLTVEQGRAPLSSFGPYLGRGGLPPQGSSVLASPRTWLSGANYWKGGLVAGEIDRRIRVATDSEHSLQTVFSGMNAHRGNVTGPVMERLVAAAAGPEVRAALVSYATTPRSPQIWSRETHERVFDEIPARVSALISERADAFAVSGPFRNATLTPRRAQRAHVGSPKLTLFTGETLSVTANVTNAGGATTDYEVPFAVGKRVVANATGSVAPGETVVTSFERTFTETGERVLAVGSDEVTVEVYDPAPVSVRRLRANRTALSTPGTVEFTLTVANNYSVPARGNVTLARNGEEILNRTVSLGAGARRTLTTTVRLDRTGRYGFSTGETSVNVTVGDVTAGGDGDGGVGDGDAEQSDGANRSGSDGDDAGPNGGNGNDGNATGESGDSGPGFGVAVAVVALLGTVLVLRRRRS